MNIGAFEFRSLMRKFNSIEEELVRQ